jgi:transposase
VVRRALAGAQKGALEEDRTIIWVDESGFYLLPGCVRTYAPRGQTPTLPVRLTRDHLSVIGGVTLDGRLLLQVQDQAFKSPDVVRFLQHLLAQVPGKLLVIWDGASIHHGQPIKDFLAAGAAARVQLERLPGYAPDLNPLDQGLWQQLKHVELANVCCANQLELRHALRQAVARVRRKRHLIHGFIRHAGYQL